MSASSQQVPCPVCGTPLALRLARGRKSGKPFVMLLCSVDGRHFRGFINDREFVSGVLSRLEGHTTVVKESVDLEITDASDPSETDLDRGDCRD